MGRSVSGIRLAAAALLFVPLLAGAAGLGRLTVLSALGQPLEAEIEVVSLQPGEEEGLSARLAAPDAFRQAGMELSPVLLGAQFSIERRAGRPVVRMRTAQPVNEPFLDVLVELQWASGRLVREYTLLLDPQEYKGPAPIAAAPPAPAAKPAPAPVPAPTPAPTPAAAEPPRLEARPIPPKPAPRPAAAATHEVKKGETLGAIARRNLHEGVTLNQMLIALFRANRDAFIHDNVNLVRAGRILSIPDRDAAMSVDATEANRVVQAHMAQFAEYRRTLAGAVAAAPATTAPAPREVTGRIAPKPEAPASAEPKDQLRLSRVEPAKPGAPGTRAAIEDDRIARERALQEAQSRISELERNVADLRKLLELKSQQLAALESKAAAPVAPALKPEPPKPSPEPVKAASEAAKRAAEAPKQAEAAKPAAEAPKAAEPVKAAEPAKAAEAPKAPAKQAAEAKKPKPAPVKAPEPDVIDEVMNFITDPVSGGGLALVLVLLGVYAGWQWRRKKAAQAGFQDSVLGAASGAGAPSVFGAAAQPADAAAAAAAGAAGAVAAGQAVAAEQPKPAPVEAEELDPIAEADVYMAYGRNAQAEEILKEALAKDPDRLAVHAKLLEVYANQKDTQAFEQTALKVKSLTGASGPEWDKAVALGHAIDPGNPLYGTGVPATAPVETVAAAPALDFDLGSGAAATAPDAARADATAPLDFDLGAGAPQGAGAGEHQDVTAPLDFDLGAGAPQAAAAGAGQDTTAPLDFDLGAEPEKSDFAPGGTLVLDAGEAKAASSGLDFDLDKTIVATPTPPATKHPADSDATVAMDFDLNLDLGEAKPEPKPAAAPEAPVDLGAISLDLGESSAPAAGGDEKWRSMSEKLELSRAFLDIGQKDEARELLNEVMKEGDAAQQAQARQMLASLG